MEAIASRIDLEKKATDGSSRLIIRRLGFVRQREYGRLMAESIIPTMPNQVVAARLQNCSLPLEPAIMLRLSLYVSSSIYYFCT